MTPHDDAQAILIQKGKEMTDQRVGELRQITMLIIRREKIWPPWQPTNWREG